MPRVRECCKHQHKLWNILKKKKKEIFKVSVTAEKQKCCISSETDERKSAEWKKKNLELLLVTCHQMTEV